MSAESYGTCRFAFLDFRDKNAEDGNCYRFPPHGDREWPYVRRGDWCGEWKPIGTEPVGIPPRPSFAHGRTASVVLDRPKGRVVPR